MLLSQKGGPSPLSPLYANELVLYMYVWLRLYVKQGFGSCYISKPDPFHGCYFTFSLQKLEELFYKGQTANSHSFGYYPTVLNQSNWVRQSEPSLGDHEGTVTLVAFNSHHLNGVISQDFVLPFIKTILHELW